MAAYHHFRNNLYGVVLGLLDQRADLTVVVLPRNQAQQEFIQNTFRHLRVPWKPLIGADLVFHSDVVISAGGTMNREAAVLGTPAYTIFAGELPAVDRSLVELGRLAEIRTVEDLSRIRFEKNKRKEPLANQALCDEIVEEICALAPRVRKKVSPATRSGRRLPFARLDLFRLYYVFKGLIPRRTQLVIRRVVARAKRDIHAAQWPIDERAGDRPDHFTGWPGDRRFALVLRHDIESRRGLDRVPELARLEARLGFRSAYYFVAHSYQVSDDLLDDLRAKGNEVGVHGWTHDGRLYLSRSIFRTRAARINKALEDWRAVGFASPSAHHNFEWIHDLRILYDASSFDTDPFEPQPESIGTVFPLLIRGEDSSYVELPYTLAQDFTLYVILRARDTTIWRRKLDWLAEKGGMAFVNTHPDYMCFHGRCPGGEEYPVERYEELLKYLLSRYEGQFWHALPREVAAFWRDNCNNGWRAVGAGGLERR